MVALLLENGANRMPLMEAVGHHELKAVKVLLAHGAGSRVSNPFGFTPIEMAREERRPECEALLKVSMAEGGRQPATTQAVP